MDLGSSVLKEQNIGRTLDLELKLKVHLCHFSSFELHFPYLFLTRKIPIKELNYTMLGSYNTST